MRKPRRTGARRGGAVPPGWHTKTRSQSDGTRAVRACRVSPLGRSGARAPSISAAGASGGVLGPPVPESAGDYGGEAVAHGPFVISRAGPADRRDAATARAADRAGPVSYAPHLGTAIARHPGSVARSNRLPGSCVGGTLGALARRQHRGGDRQHRAASPGWGLAQER